MDARGNEFPLSATKFNAGKHEVLNLVAPARVQPSAAEYQRLSDDLARQIGEGQLGAAREDKERRDLSLLHQATGWDARLIALAAIADRLNAESSYFAGGALRLAARRTAHGQAGTRALQCR